VGSTVTWTYIVTNTGNVTLTNVNVVDDNGTPGNLGDDIAVGTITTLLPGSANAQTLTASRPAQLGQYQNAATAKATATFTDGSSQPVSASAIDRYLGAVSSLYGSVYYDA